MAIVGPLDDRSHAEMLLARWLGGGNLNDPRTINEKIQWLKLNDRQPHYHQLADKFAVREFVAERIGHRYLNDLLAVYDNADDIDFDSLPRSFVLKATHGSGMNIIVAEKRSLDRRDAVKKLNDWLSIDYSLATREWVYRGIQPRIICEPLLSDGIGDVPRDFKVWCFSGRPAHISVLVDRFGDMSQAVYDADWNRLPVTYMRRRFDGEVDRPEHLAEMLNAARELARGIPFVRVDFYALPEVIFGEMTFYPSNGITQFEPASWDRRLGDELVLPAPRQT